VSTPPKPAQIFLLPALQAPIVIVLRRKPSKRWHVLKWNTRDDSLESGSWFDGKLWFEACDVSFDGGWMVYSARGQDGSTEWGGVCQMPWLRTIVSENRRSCGGGFWHSRDEISLGGWSPVDGDRSALPFSCTEYLNGPKVRDELRRGRGILSLRLRRHGWTPAEGRYRLSDHPLTSRVRDEWTRRPVPTSPTLRLVFDSRSDERYFFLVQEKPGLLDERVSWATWDSDHNLVFAREGVLYCYSQSALRTGEPSSVIDLEPLVKPPRADG
jgi:hypothetical protein